MNRPAGPSPLLSVAEVALVLAAVGVVLAVSGARWLSIPVGLVLVGGPLLLLALSRRRRDRGVRAPEPGN